MTTRIQFDFPAAWEPAFRGGARRRPSKGPLACVFAAFDLWRQRRVLEELDDRMLRDIGISRSQALAEASKPCWRR